MEPETLAYAYIIIVPNPMESETLGIRRETAADKLGEYYFWMKIGDSDNPKQRLSQYQDPDSAYVTLRLATTGGFDNPGKALELAHLMHNAKGGLKPGATTEWRALCAMDEEGAFDLRDRLISLLEEVPEKIHTYKQASKLIKTAVKNTYTAGWSVRGPGETTAGFTTFDGNGNYGPSVFRVSLKGTVSMCNTADSLVASHYVNLCPDVSYNARQLPNGWNRSKCKAAAKSVIEDMAKKFKIVKMPDFKSRKWQNEWLTIQIDRLDINTLLDLRDFVREFQDLALT